jgi:tRNA(Ile)-lysidine synthase TilS/MesJ
MLSMKKNIFDFLDILSNNFYKYLYKLYNFYKYKNILEYVPNLDTKIKNQICNINSPDTSILIDTINSICNNLNTKNIIISLSGGVDSMVLTTILQKSGFNIVGIHINYNNRVESKHEERFLREWCKFNEIKLYVNSLSENIKRGNMKRSDYESETKEIRLNFYKKIMKEENIDYVLLAHHKDDINIEKL